MKIKIEKARRIFGYGYSKMVTLPAVWIDSHNLKRRSLVSMEIDNDGRLIIEPYKVEKEVLEEC